MPAIYRNKHPQSSSMILFRRKEEDFLAHALLEHVLHNNREAAKALYALRPDLLFTRALAIDASTGLDANFFPVHRVVNTSPYRAIAASGNIFMLHELQNCDAIKNYIDPNTGKSSYQLMIEQLQAQFPNGFSYPLPQCDYSSFGNLITTDANLKAMNQPSQLTEKSLLRFRHRFLPNKKNPQDATGYYSNLSECANAFSYLDKQASQWNQHQINYFFIQIIGNLLGLLSFTDAALFLKIHEEKIMTPDDEVNGSYCDLSAQIPHLQNMRILTPFFAVNPPWVLGRDYSLTVNTIDNTQPQCVVGTDQYHVGFDFVGRIKKIQAMKTSFMHKHFEVLEAGLQNETRPTMN